MKIRNHRKREWWFYPHRDSKLCKGRCYIFKYKADLLKFLNNNFPHSLNGEVFLEERNFGSSGPIRQWFVWYNDYRELNEPLKIELKQMTFRGRKYIRKPSKVSKEGKKYFAFSNKVVNLINSFYNKQDELIITKNKAKKLVDLFYKRGFKDFEPNKEELEYIKYYIDNGIDFYHWSDRCNFLRTKTIIEYFKKENLI